VLVGWLIPPVVLLQLGFTTAATFNAEISGYPATLWWPWSILGALIVLAAGYYSIRTSAWLGTILGLFEIGMFLALAVFLVVHAGHNNTWSVFSTKYTPAASTGSWERSAAPCSRCSRSAASRAPYRWPRRPETRAAPSSGPCCLQRSLSARFMCSPRCRRRSVPAQRFHQLHHRDRQRVMGGPRPLAVRDFWSFVFLAIVNSTIANANAGINVSSRTSYAMGRIGAFPRFFELVNPRHRSPVNSALVAFAVTIAVTLGLGFGYTPTGAFAMVGTGIVIVLVAIYILMNAACIGFFARRGGGLNVFSHLVIPLLGIAAFVPAWLTAAGIKVFSFVAPLTPPCSHMGPAVAAWMVIGVIYLIYLYNRNPRRVAEVGLVHLDAEVQPASGASSRS
jgi:amino acid transporter